MDLSELSEELDSNLWLGRLKVVWDSVQPQDWVGAWVPLFRAGWGLAETLYALQIALRSVDSTRDDLGEILTEMVEDLGEMRQSFPDAGQVFVGVERLDTLVRSLGDHPDFQEWKIQFLEAVTRLVEDIVAKGLDLLLNPESAGLYDVPLARILQTLELIAGRVVDELLRSRHNSDSAVE